MFFSPKVVTFLPDTITSLPMTVLPVPFTTTKPSGPAVSLITALSLPFTIMSLSLFSKYSRRLTTASTRTYIKDRSWFWRTDEAYHWFLTL